jgi:hypothetical protein
MKQEQVVTSNRQRQADPATKNLEVLQAQVPGQVALTRDQTAKACGFKHPVTVDRLRQRGLLHPNLTTRRPVYPLTEIARFISQ